MGMGKGFQLLKIGGVRIEIDFSWLFIAALVVFSLGAGYFPANFPSWGDAQIWTAAVITALLFFASVLIHELSHSLVAKSRGIEVDSIRLFIFGGVSNIKREARKPSEEFIIAFVGPLSSFVLAGLFYLIAIVAPPEGAVRAVASYLVFINLALGIFNLIPGFPLDGGRVLRSIIWAVTKNYTTATRIAAGAGRVIGYLFIFLGLWQILTGGGFINGLWTGLIGWFIISAASQNYEQVVISNMLRGVKVGQVMTLPRETVAPNLTVGQLINQYFIYRGEQVLPVVDNNRLVGVIAPQNIRQVPPNQWENVTVGQLMLPRQSLPVAHPTDDLQATLETLGQAERAPFILPVLDANDQFVGVVTPFELMRFLQFRRQYGDVPSGLPYNQPGQPLNNDYPNNDQNLRAV